MILLALLALAALFALGLGLGMADRRAIEHARERAERRRVLH
jgi:hypothetical protein